MRKQSLVILVLVAIGTITVGVSYATVTQFSGNYAINDQSGNATRFYIQGSSTFVGVGTTSPTQQLTVKSSDDTKPAITILSLNNTNKRLYLQDDGTHSRIGLYGFREGSGGGPLNLILEQKGGNVGIDTTAPAQNLEVNGTALIDSKLSVAGNINSTSASTFKITAPSGVGICIGTGC